MTVTSDRFLQGLKRRITIPANQPLMTDQNFLDLANDVIRDRMVPLFLSTNQNYFVTYVDFPMTQGVKKYPIHYRAIGRALRDLKLKYNLDNIRMVDMRLIALEDEHLFINQTLPTGFYFSGDSIMVVPEPNSSTYIMRQFFNLQPNRMVTMDQAAKVVAIAGNVLTVDAIPAAFLPPLKVDFIQGKAGCSTISYDVTLQGAASNQLTFASASDLAGVEVGDYVALAQESPVMQLPDEAQQLLETATADRVLYAIGDYEGSAAMQKDAKLQEMNLLKIIQPRIEGEQTKIINRNGLLRGRGYNYWRVRGGYYW
jgi:hypothetical protein